MRYSFLYVWKEGKAEELHKESHIGRHIYHRHFDEKVSTGGELSFHPPLLWTRLIIIVLIYCMYNNSKKYKVSQKNSLFNKSWGNE